MIATDSQAPDYEAANVIDGDPQTIWHTPWDDQGPGFPHYLVIEFAGPVAMSGLKVLPRQDMPNGRIKDYEVFVSDDGKNWGSAVRKGKFASSGEMQIIQFGQPSTAKYLKFVALSFVREEAVCVDGGVGGRPPRVGKCNVVYSAQLFPDSQRMH